MFWTIPCNVISLRYAFISGLKVIRYLSLLFKLPDTLIKRSLPTEKIELTITELLELVFANDSIEELKFTIWLL
ncbi:hypothetical protein NWE61_00290 [Mycoplasmopsis felis]|uniref:hypothetical protein n=1 Tax=Mycoplasmopsis felis TaxID=33923 RepID=UPI0021E06227|nr:hypothetical protein [Mycoplasmopsis felis]MCU9933684.1 hypothetical protein [Mycoplasmopsis felis]